MLHQVGITTIKNSNYLILILESYVCRILLPALSNSSLFFFQIHIPLLNPDKNPPLLTPDTLPPSYPWPRLFKHISPSYHTYLSFASDAKFISEMIPINSKSPLHLSLQATDHEPPQGRGDLPPSNETLITVF